MSIDPVVVAVMTIGMWTDWPADSGADEGRSEMARGSNNELDAEDDVAGSMAEREYGSAKSQRCSEHQRRT